MQSYSHDAARQEKKKEEEEEDEEESFTRIKLVHEA